MISCIGAAIKPKTKGVELVSVKVALHTPDQPKVWFGYIT